MKMMIILCDKLHLVKLAPIFYSFGINSDILKFWFDFVSSTKWLEAKYPEFIDDIWLLLALGLRFFEILYIIV